MLPKQPMMSKSEPSDMMETEGMDGSEPMSTESGAGYQIVWKVKPDGSMSVCQKPLDAEPNKQGMGMLGGKDEAYREIPVKNEEQALKAVLKIYQDNPMGGDESSGFDAGFGSQPESVPGRGMIY